MGSPQSKHHKTDFKGVTYILTQRKGKEVKTYFVRYYSPDGKLHWDKAGPGATTPAKANATREWRMQGRELPNKVRRGERKAAKVAKAEAESGRMTFHKLFDAYLLSKGKYPRLSTDRGYFNNYLLEPFGDKSPLEIDPVAVDEARETMLDSLSPASVRAVLKLLVRLSTFGAKRRISESIPFPIEMPKGEVIKTEQMSNEQMVSYMEAAKKCESPVYGSFLLFELLTGMRMGEVRKLEWSDVDLNRNGIRIRDPKGGRDQAIPLGKAAKEVLLSLPRDPDNLFVFQGPRGEQVSCHYIKKYGHQIKEEVGLPDDFRINHGLRHSFASALASSGKVDLYTLQRLLTHQNPQMTQRYAHLRDETLRSATDIMGGIVNGEK